MSRMERIADDTGETGIEPGKRLIRADDPSGQSWLARLGYRVQRLVWRTPLHQVRLRGKMPLRLLAVPKDPIPGDKVAGEALLAGRLARHGVEIDLASFDFAGELPPALTDHLQSFAWLRDLGAAATRERGAKTAEGMMRRWLGAHAELVAEPAWRADLWGRRILFWTAYAPYILSARDPVYRSAVLRALARGARHLERGADRARVGVPRIVAWAGVIAAALVLQGGPARLASGEAGLSRALRQSLHDDNGLLSRSPLEQVDLVETLAQLRAVYIAGRRATPDWLDDALQGAAAALLSATLGDGGLSSWQGGNMAEPRRIAAAVDASGAPVRPLRAARGWGYQRAEARTSVVVFDAAPPPPPRALKGGCASTLAFEFSDGADRLIVNCGGDGASGTLPAEFAHALRATAASSTLTLGDRNSTAVQDDGTLGKGVVEVETSRDDTGGAARLEASHDGYARRFGLIHERRLALSADGRLLNGEDRLYPAGNRRRRKLDSVPVAVRFHLGPTVEGAPTADGQGALLRIRGGAVWQFRCRGGRLELEDSIWIDGAGRPQPVAMLAIASETPADGMTISWELVRAS